MQNKVEVDQLRLQPLDLEGAKTLVDWARNEGWNPGPYDYEVFWNTDPDGFVGFYLEDQLIAGGSIISYYGEFGFMGLFIVHPDYRGQGIGMKLWFLRRDLLLERLNPGATIGMDGVVDMQPFYQKGGFEIAFKDERYERIGEHFQISDRISEIMASDYEMIKNYDQECFGFERTAFLEPWLHLPKGRAFKYMEGDRLQGFAVLRVVDSGFKIGPLFADNSEVAEELYKACLSNAVGRPVFLDIPLSNQAAVKLIHKYNGKYVFECARMYYGDPPNVDMNKVFGITTFELG